MEMLKCSEDFRAQVLRVVSQFSQRGVDPRKHARSRPMRFNIRRPFDHDVNLARSNERSSAASERKVAGARCCGLFRTQSFYYQVAQAIRARLPWQFYNELGDCHGQPIFPIGELQRAQRLLECSIKTFTSSGVKA
jgi:hypothetical protein